ncbi:hypothetical protein V8B97DRAFT_2026757 [Scleroderma yunnanense]
MFGLLCIDLTQQDSTGSSISPITTTDFTKNTDRHSLFTQDSNSNFEAQSDYYSLPSKPVSRVPKETRPICEHLITDVWDKLGLQVFEYLDSVNVTWTTIDPVHFAEVEKDTGPILLWNVEVTAVSCKKLLKEFEITNVEVMFQKLLFTWSASQQLFNYVSSVHATTKVSSPLTPALSLQIAAQATPCFDGTRGIYICEGGKSERVFILMSWYVVLLPNAGHNELYACTKASQPHHNVLFSSKAYQHVLKFIMVRIGHQAILVDHYKDELEGLGEAEKDHNDTQAEEQKKFKDLLEKAEKAINTLHKFHSESQHILGHIAYSPYFCQCQHQMLHRGWALIKLHGKKIDWDAFKGNVIDLDVPPPTVHTSFKYLHGCLLPLWNVVKECKLHHPTMLDTNGELCLIVVKNGNSTSVTIGRATCTMFFVQEYFKDGTHETSMELAIYPYSHKDGAFSTLGDSGSIIADSKGGIVGLFTGSASQADSTDVTYATPFYWLFDECISVHFCNAYLYPIKTYAS